MSGPRTSVGGIPASIRMLTPTPIRRYRGEAPTHHARMTTVSASRLKPQPGAARHHRGPGRPRVRTSVGTHRPVRHPASGGRRDQSPGGTPHVDALAPCPGPRGRAHRLHAGGRVQPGCDRQPSVAAPSVAAPSDAAPSMPDRVGVAVGVLTQADRSRSMRRVPSAGPALVPRARRLHAVVTCSRSVVVRAPRDERDSDAQPRLGGERTPAGG